MKTLSSYLKPRPRYTMPLLAAALILYGMAGWIGMLAYGQHAIAEQALRRGDRHRAIEAADKPAPKLSPAQQENLKHWAALRAERAFAWKPLFAAIERSASPDIELLQFQPEKESRRITLQGEAKSRKALTDFLDALGRRGVLRNVYLSHQQKKARDRLETVEFEIHAAIGG